MKTTFVLHGGLTSFASQNNTLFFKAITSQLKDGDKVLFVGFARDDEKIEAVYERDKKALLEQTDRNVNVINAIHENFAEQIQSSAVVYITGGDTRKLLKELKQYPELPSLLDGKTIVGSSAGANVFSSLYYSTTLKTVCEGLGILPYLLVCHYGNTELGADERAVAKLRRHNDTYNVITLEEQNFKCLEIDLHK